MKKVGLGPTASVKKEEPSPPLDALNNTLTQPASGSAIHPMAARLQERARKILSSTRFESASVRISTDAFSPNARALPASVSSGPTLPPDPLAITTTAFNTTLQPKSWANSGSPALSSHPTIIIDFSDIDPHKENIEQALIEKLYQTLQAFKPQADELHPSWRNFLSAAFDSGQVLAPAKPISLAPSNLDALIDWLRDLLEKSADCIALEFNNVPEELSQSEGFKDFLGVLNEVSNERITGQSEAEKLPGAQLIVMRANP